jgi:SAM-dependent methyltransferase
MANLPHERELKAPPPGDHWDAVWDKADPDRVSWFEPRPETSLRLIETSGIGPRGAVIDVGGGASWLTRKLLDAGYGDLTVLDISDSGLAAGRARLGPAAPEVEWIRADIRSFEPTRKWDLWHDRAVFHFLTQAEDRAAYRAVLESALAAGGQVVLATFGPEGPVRCSGLDVRRYSIETLAAELGPGFRLAGSSLETHTTPAGAAQQFLYARFVSV